MIPSTNNAQEQAGNMGRVSLYVLIRQKLERQPELLSVARENCARWLQQGHSAPGRLQQWDRILEAAQQSENGRKHLFDILGAKSAEDERLRDFHPFAGILTREERRQATELCGYRH